MRVWLVLGRDADGTAFLPLEEGTGVTDALEDVVKVCM